MPNIDPLVSPEHRAALERAIAERLAPINERLDRGAEKMDAMSSSIGEIRAELASNTITTNEVRELLDVGRNGLKVLGWIGIGAKWAGGVSTAILALWTAFYAATHNGQLPK